MDECGDRDGATAVAELVYLLDEAFAGSGIEESNEAQSLLANQASVSEEQWRAVPNGGVRTVESIALHVGACQFMYDAYVFGSGERRWDDPGLTPWPEGHAPMQETVDWLKASHARFVRPRRTTVGRRPRRPAPRELGRAQADPLAHSTILQHDTYHAGEINHIRSLLAEDHRWRWG